MAVPIRYWMPALAAAAATVVGVVLAKRERAEAPKLKTIADIRPPRVIPGCETVDWTKVQPVTYANDLGARLLEGRFQAVAGSRRPTKEEPRGSFDCPCAASL